MNTLSETGLFMSFTYSVRVRNQSLYMPHEQERTSGNQEKTFDFLKSSF